MMRSTYKGIIRILFSALLVLSGMCFAEAKTGSYFVCALVKEEVCEFESNGMRQQEIGRHTLNLLGNRNTSSDVMPSEKQYETESVTQYIHKADGKKRMLQSFSSNGKITYWNNDVSYYVVCDAAG